MFSFSSFFFFHFICLFCWKESQSWSQWSPRKTIFVNYKQNSTDSCAYTIYSTCLHIISLTSLEFDLPLCKIGNGECNTDFSTSSSFHPCYDSCCEDHQALGKTNIIDHFYFLLRKIPTYNSVNEQKVSLLTFRGTF